jgi:hypothetical protein
MRFLSGFILIILLALALYYFMPWWWWSAIVPAMLLGFGLQMKGYQSFLCGFLSVGLFWYSMALWSNALNGGILLEKMSRILPFGSPTMTLLVVGIIGALLGGLSMLSAKYLRDIVSGPIIAPKSKNRGKYR